MEDRLLEMSIEGVISMAELRTVLEEELAFQNGVNSALVTTILDHVVIKKCSTKVANIFRPLQPSYCGYSKGSGGSLKGNKRNPAAASDAAPAWRGGRAGPDRRRIWLRRDKP